MTPTTSITIRPMRADEKPQVGRIMRRAFAPTVWPFFSWTKDVLVAEYDNRVIGAILLKTFTAAKRKVGFLAWDFTDPDYRGLGAGQALIEHGIAFLEAQGCTEISGCVEGYNSSSFKQLSTRGFSILSPGEQLRRYGLGILSYWWHAMHVFDVGHFLWAMPAQQHPDNPAMQWLGTWLLNALFLLLAFIRNGSLERTDLWAVPLAMLAVFGLRSLAMWAGARLVGLAVRYRAWESTVPLVALVAVLFSGFFPFPGSFYPTGDRWRYRDYLPKLGPMALAASLTMLTLAWGSWAALRFELLPAIQPFWKALHQLSGTLALLDSVAAFFPVISFNGRRLWDWNKSVWALVSLGAVALIFFAKL